MEKRAYYLATIAFLPFKKEGEGKLLELAQAKFSREIRAEIETTRGGHNIGTIVIPAKNGNESDPAESREIANQAKLLAKEIFGREINSTRITHIDQEGKISNISFLNGQTRKNE